MAGAPEPRTRRPSPGAPGRVALDQHTTELLVAHRDWTRGNCDQLGITMDADAYVFLRLSQRINAAEALQHHPAVSTRTAHS